MLRNAVEWGVIEHVPCTIRLLKIGARSVDFYDFDEYERLVTAARAMAVTALAIVLLGGDAGLRSAEMRALRWTDLDLGKGQIRVECSDWRGHVTTTKGGRIRYVPMTRRLLESLRTHRHLRGSACSTARTPRT